MAVRGQRRRADWGGPPGFDTLMPLAFPRESIRQDDVNADNASAAIPPVSFNYTTAVQADNNHQHSGMALAVH